MDYREFLKRSLDASAITSAVGTTLNINPTVWDRQLRDFQARNLVITPLAETFDMRAPGSSYVVTVEEAPTVAGAVDETASVTIKAFATRQITFTPAEYGDAYEITTKEEVRAFFPFMEKLTRRLGYSLAYKKDALAYAELITSTNGIMANSKTVSSTIAATDVLGLSDITKAMYTIENKQYKPSLLLISNIQKKQLLDNTQLISAEKFGTRDVIGKGVIGELFGLMVVVSDNVTVGSNRCKAVLLGETRSGEKALGYAIKRDVMMESDRLPLERKTQIVATEEYDFALIHQDAVVTIETYA